MPRTPPKKRKTAARRAPKRPKRPAAKGSAGARPKSAKPTRCRSHTERAPAPAAGQDPDAARPPPAARSSGAGPGRPTILTRELSAKIAEALEDGNYIETAAAMHGVHKSTLYDWMKRGARIARDLQDEPRELAADEALLVEFSDAIKRAMASAEAWCVAGLVRAGRRPNHWQALAWLLERKFPDRYGRRTVVKVGAAGPEDDRDDFDPGKLTTDELLELDRLLARGAGAELAAPETATPKTAVLERGEEGEPAR